MCPERRTNAAQRTNGGVGAARSVAENSTAQSPMSSNLKCARAEKRVSYTRPEPNGSTISREWIRIEPTLVAASAVRGRPADSPHDIGRNGRTYEWWEYDAAFSPPVPKGAVPGDVSKQVFCSACQEPKYFYVDETRTCVQCGSRFIFSGAEQK